MKKLAKGQDFTLEFIWVIGIISVSVQYKCNVVM
jgi:hypothetical protein